eukprot:366130-Chlamydomonas_euryale.AAC.55
MKKATQSAAVGAYGVDALDTVCAHAPPQSRPVRCSTLICSRKGTCDSYGWGWRPMTEPLCSSSAARPMSCGEYLRKNRQRGMGGQGQCHTCHAET